MLRKLFTTRSYAFIILSFLIIHVKASLSNQVEWDIYFFKSWSLVFRFETLQCYLQLYSVWMQKINNTVHIRYFYFKKKLFDIIIHLTANLVHQTADHRATVTR